MRGSKELNANKVARRPLLWLHFDSNSNSVKPDAQSKSLCATITHAKNLGAKLIHRLGWHNKMLWHRIHIPYSHLNVANEFSEKCLFRNSGNRLDIANNSLLCIRVWLPFLDTKFCCTPCTKHVEKTNLRQIVLGNL